MDGMQVPCQPCLSERGLPMFIHCEKPVVAKINDHTYHRRCKCRTQRRRTDRCHRQPFPPEWEQARILRGLKLDKKRVAWGKVLAFVEFLFYTLLGGRWKFLLDIGVVERDRFRVARHGRARCTPESQ